MMIPEKPKLPSCVKTSEREQPEEKRLDAKWVVLIEERINSRCCALKKQSAKQDARSGR